ncbi:MAG: hypothetical protein IT580_23140 [Verrucomicrobiales bacterium]|nr:hypothetical protein [Verrucomicrobiales bacterium]
MLFLEVSADLVQWSETARFYERIHPFAQEPIPLQGHRYHRVRITPADAADGWVTQLRLASPRFFAPGGAGALPTIKFSFLLSTPWQVYFQDTVRYPFHFDFARAHVPGYATIPAAEFYRQSLYPGAAQRMVVGTVMKAPRAGVLEAGIEITGATAFPASAVALWVDRVRKHLAADPSWRIFYLPSPEQRAETEANLAAFTAFGIEVSHLERWASLPSPP